MIIAVSSGWGSVKRGLFIAYLMIYASRDPHCLRDWGMSITLYAVSWSLNVSYFSAGLKGKSEGNSKRTMKNQAVFVTVSRNDERNAVCLRLYETKNVQS